MTLSLVYLLALVSPASAGGDWPQFRGPGGQGISRSANPPAEWSETRNVAWKVAVPGVGRSSPVIAGDRIWLTTALAQGLVRKRVDAQPAQVADRVSLHVVCLNRSDGSRLWDTTVFDVEKPAPVHVLNSFATPTPVVEGGRLYCDFGLNGTACLDAATGKVRWTKRLVIDHMVGPGSSPIVHDGLLVLVRDGTDLQYVTALDKETGRTVWKTDRPPIHAGNHAKKAFSTPLAIAAGGATQIVVLGAQWVVSYEPATGKEIWRVRHGTGFSGASRPVSGHGMVYICTGAMRSQLWAIRVDGRGDVTASHVAWRVTAEALPIMSSPLLVGRELYTVSDSGLAICFDALTGKVVWRSRLRGTHLASPTLAGGRLYFCDIEGKATVLKAGRQLEKLAESKLDGAVAASPAFVGNCIFLRTDTHLYRIEER